ncbi:MAG TPA: hypothetical protein VGN42_27210 [Pirellulales bacterium]|nr:hypothetical protein [Pirellulales bacterium]
MLSHQELAAGLQARVRRMEGAHHVQGKRITTGIEALDRLLPGRGLPSGALAEWVGEPGGGAGSLALIAAREACREGGALVAVDRQRCFYPPAADALGIDLENLMVVRPQSQADERWAVHQALSCRAVAAVLCWPEQLDDRTFRRWQLAAEKGGGLGLLVRPERALASPAWSEVRLRVRAVPGSIHRRLCVEVIFCRGGRGGESVEVELDDATNPLHLASRLDDSAPRHRAAGKA